MLKRILPAFIAVLCVVGYLVAQPTQQKQNPTRQSLFGAPGISFHVVARDTNMNASGTFELLSRTAYTAMPRQDTLRIISSSTADSARITIYGVLNSDTSNTYETLRVSGTDSVFGSKVFRHIEAAYADTESAGTISIISKTGGLVTTILPGQLQTYTGLHFTGRNGSVIRRFSVEADTGGGPVRFELRFYPDFSDIGQSPETGNRTLSHKTLNATAGAGAVRVYEGKDLDWFVTGGGAVAAFAAGSGSTKILNLEIDGFDLGK